MPYRSNSDLPESVSSHLPPHAQDIYRKAFNSAWDEYEDPQKRKKGGSREGTAHAVAWSAVEQEYEKRGGEWRKREEKH